MAALEVRTGGSDGRREGGPLEKVTANEMPPFNGPLLT